MENFLSGMDPGDYVDQLSREIAEATRRTAQESKYLNPNPFIKTFTQLQKQLGALQQECSHRKSVLQKDVSHKEQIHYQNVIKQTTEASDIQTRFNELSSNVSKLSVTTTEPLGEKLHKVKRVKDNSDAIIRITRAYNNFYTTGQPTTDLMKRNESSAVLLNQLIKLSSKLIDGGSLPNSKETHGLILKFGDDFENDMLSTFKSKYRAGLYDQLYLITRSLFAYNDGANIVDYFVDNHSVLLQFESMNEGAVGSTILNWINQLSDPYLENYSTDDETAELFKEIKDLLISQIEPITKSFQENSQNVLVTFLKKAFEKIVHKRIDPILTRAFEVNKLSYLRILQLYSNEVYETIVINLKLAFEIQNKELNDEIESLFTDLFFKYFQNESYFKIEKINLENLINGLIDPFINHNGEVIKRQLLSERIEIYKEEQENDPKNINATQKQDNNDPDVSLTKDDTISSSASSVNESTQASSKMTISSRAMARFEFYLADSRNMREKFRNARQKVPRSTRFKKIVSKVPFMKGNERATNDNFSIMGFKAAQTSGSEVEDKLSLETTEKIFKFVIESLNRATGLVPNQMNQYTMELFELLLNKVGPSYISIGLGSMYQNFIYPFIPGFRSRSIFELDVSFLSQFKIVSLQLFIMSNIIKKIFYPLLNNKNLFNKLSVLFNGYIQDVEIGINIIIDEIVKLVEIQIDLILKAQPINDYMIEMDDCTNSCDQLCRFLENLFQSIQTSLQFSSQLKMNVISKISNYLLNALIFQYTKFQFNDYGITTLTNDSIQYLSLFNVLKANTLEYSNQYLQYTGDDDEDTELVKDEIGYETNKIEDFLKAYQILNDLPGLFNATSLQQLRDFATEGRLKYLKKDILDKLVQKRVINSK